MCWLRARLHDRTSQRNWPAPTGVSLSNGLSLAEDRTSGLYVMMMNLWTDLAMADQGVLPEAQLICRAFLDRHPRSYGKKRNEGIRGLSGCV